ncbi:MAG: hypothetical protein IJ666_08615 [Ruminococcus sp.]|nr:hypothetical protein [Ruminococcus sp.]
MKADRLEKLLETVEKSSENEYYSYDTDIFYLFEDILKAVPDCIFARVYIMIDNWLGISMRDGVWTFYENFAGNRGLADTVEYLKHIGENQMAVVFAYGIHPYDDKKYDDFHYPLEWIEDSDEIDDWIYDNESKIISVQRDIILSNKEIIKSINSKSKDFFR